LFYLRFVSDSRIVEAESHVIQWLLNWRRTRWQGSGRTGADISGTELWIAGNVAYF